MAGDRSSPSPPRPLSPEAGARGDYYLPLAQEPTPPRGGQEESHAPHHGPLSGSDLCQGNGGAGPAQRYYFNRVLYGLVLLFALFIVYESFSWRLAMGRASIRMMAEIAHSLFMAVANVQYWAVYLLCPLFLAGVICSEREERTLELLFTTRLTDREIVLGKLGSRIAVFSLLILCGLPVMSLVMFFGGIDPNALWRMLAVTLLAILYTSAHAIYFSAVTKGAMGAVVRTYWWMALWLFGVPLLAMIPLATIRSTWAIYQVMTGILFLNPIGPYIVVIVPDAYTAVEKNLGPWFFPFTFVVPTSWSLFLIWRAVRRVRLDPTILGLLVEKSSMFSGVRRPPLTVERVAGGPAAGQGREDLVRTEGGKPFVAAFSDRQGVRSRGGGRPHSICGVARCWFLHSRTRSLPDP